MTTDITLNDIALSTAVPDALVTLPTRPLVGERRDKFVDVPGRAGSWKFAEQPGDRTLRFAIHIQSEGFEERRASVEALADWCDTPTTQRLVVSDRPDRFHEVLLENDPDPDEWLNTGEADLKFRAGPYALALDLSSEILAAVSGGPTSGTFSAPDTIDAEPIIEITADDGDIPSFTFTLNGDTIGYTGPTVAIGNTVTISTVSDTVTSGTNGDAELTGAYFGSVVVLSGVSGMFPLIVPGDNDWAITWEGTADNISIEITWRRRYR